MENSTRSEGNVEESRREGAAVPDPAESFLLYLSSSSRVKRQVALRKGLIFSRPCPRFRPPPSSAREVFRARRKTPVFPEPAGARNFRAQLNLPPGSGRYYCWPARTGRARSDGRDNQSFIKGQAGVSPLRQGGPLFFPPPFLPSLPQPSQVPRDQVLTRISRACSRQTFGLARELI